MPRANNCCGVAVVAAWTETGRPATALGRALSSSRLSRLAGAADRRGELRGVERRGRGDLLQLRAGLSDQQRRRLGDLVGGRLSVDAVRRVRDEGRILFIQQPSYVHAGNACSGTLDERLVQPAGVLGALVRIGDLSEI